MKKAAFATFRRLPGPLRRGVVRAAVPSFTVGAVVVLRRPEGYIAFVDQRHTDGWALPGGLLHRRETPADAVIREVAEEIGVLLERTTLPVPLAAVSPAVRRVDIVYVVDLERDVDVRTSDEAEVRRIGWFLPAALPEVTGPTLDILRAVRLL